MKRTNIYLDEEQSRNAEGAPARVLGAFRDGHFMPVVSEALLEEIRDVLGRARIRRRLRFADEDLATILTLLKDRAVEVSPTGTVHFCRDPGDEHLLETAMLERWGRCEGRHGDVSAGGTQELGPDLQVPHVGGQYRPAHLGGTDRNQHIVQVVAGTHAPDEAPAPCHQTSGQLPVGNLG
ncbi:MAG: putative toxin-antitoxin system toxin component, PIN family [Chloroflexi bacterium]|nr:putative toxin-antitoxin system toxin component, PIN family [Chloroflexota bacterium]